MLMGSALLILTYNISCLAGLITAGHDVSDGGVIVSLLEMAFAADCGCDVTFTCEDISQPLACK